MSMCMCVVNDAMFHPVIDLLVFPSNVYSSRDMILLHAHHIDKLALLIKRVPK